MIEIEALSFGPEIARLVASDGGRILATLSNCVYLETYQGYVAGIVGEDSVDGPLSLRVNNLPLLLGATCNQRNLSFRVCNGNIEIGDLAHISLREACEWELHLPHRLGDRAAQNEALAALAETISDYSNQKSPARTNGLSLADLVRQCHSERYEESRNDAWHSNQHLRFFVALRMTLEEWPFAYQLSDVSNRILKRLAGGILRFVDAWQAGDTKASADALVALLGLGEGLTPSGDDLVSGILAALVWRANLETNSPCNPDCLANQVLEASAQTNIISARLLHHAARGILYSPAMELGAAMLAGDTQRVREPAERLFSIGHSSGIDLATGILVACLAEQTTDNRRRSKT